MSYGKTGHGHGEKLREQQAVGAHTNDDVAARLAMLEIKRDRTMAELDAVQAAGQSVQKSMESFREKQSALNEHFLNLLDTDGTPEEQRLALYREWNSAFSNGVADYNELALERERLHMQEIILVRMLTELDFQIKALKSSFE